MIDLECEGCQRPFKAQRSTARYCSPACRQRAYRHRTPPSPTKVEPESPGQWARKIEHISASMPLDDLTDDQVADALGAAEFLHHLLRGESRIRARRANS